MRKLKEWLSIRVAKAPGMMVLFGIVAANFCLFFIAAVVISRLAPVSLAQNDFWSCVFYTVSMVLDAGSMSYVIQDVGVTSLALVLVCLITVLTGMIVFTGAVIGYVSAWISDFINTAGAGTRKLHLSSHIVILNWNTRASEIINDLMYSEKKEVVVVLVSREKDSVAREINERLADTLDRERKAGAALKNRLVIIVREGDTYSTKQLNDICLEQAKSVIILGDDISNTLCKFDYQERIDRLEKGNANTIKTLVQVAQITAAETSADNQQIVVELDDDWTLSLVKRIIAHKARKGKCNIVPIAVNRILGQILSQFTIMPELNTVYSTLFSNKDASFFVRRETEDKDENDFVKQFLAARGNAVPLTVMKDADGICHSYYMADGERFAEEPRHGRKPAEECFTVALNPDYTLEHKRVIILGHNSKSGAIMDGFNSFLNEWDDGSGNTLDIIVIDDEKNLEKQNYFKAYPYVSKVIAADVYDRDAVCGAINAFVDAGEEDTSILILSDDTVMSEDTDATALTYLIYVQDIVRDRIAKNPDFDSESIDIVVEIINPKHYDVVRNYSVDNIVISNRYISKMVTQVGEKEALFEFYNDILSYDSKDNAVFESKELYIKKAARFFNAIPAPCTAAELIRAVYAASPDDNKQIVLGYVSPGGKTVLFEGDQDDVEVALTEQDKLIIFSNH
ncbi:MAG: hypothetical protein LBH54_00795 [Clostridiales bacterium]|jgi:hypothetical protein|nr:hypothetical protein [Clostridiales bacterium]